MKLTNWMMAALVSMATMGAATSGCGGSNTTPVVRATAREIRGRVPVRTGNARITRVVAIDAKTRRVVASTTPAANGSFVLTGVTVGAMYRLQMIAGNRSIPVVFPKAPNVPAKTNLFRIGTKNSPRTGPLDGPIDVGDLTSTMVGGEEQFDTPPANAPNLQEDYDEDGMPDARDTDVDGDGTPNEMDTDNDGDGMADNAQVGDQDGDGLTNESDPDMDGDGMPNAMDTDNDNDGTPDAMDMSPNGDDGEAPGDADGDGVPDAEDTTDPDDGEVEGGGEDAGAPADASVDEDGGT